MKSGFSYCLNGGLEELNLFAFNVAEQQIGETTGTKTEPIVGEPLLAENFFVDGIEDNGVHNGVYAARRL